MTDLRPVRILVTGTRENHEVIKRLVWHRLDELTAEWPTHQKVIVVHGQCPKDGVDLFAHQWAASRGHTPEPHPADWHLHGKRAGMIRNAKMVNLGADYCVGFPAPGSKGTWDCLQKAVDAGIPTRVYPAYPPRVVALGLWEAE